MKLLDIFFPPFCVGCQKDMPKDTQFKRVCDACFLSIKEAPYQFHAEKPLDRIVWYGLYGDKILRAAIDYFKYKGTKELISPLGECMARALEEAGIDRLTHGEKLVITFISLHPLRKRFRGYNQSELLALYIGNHFSLPVLELIKRAYLTPPQARIKEENDRKENIKGVFSLLSSRVPQKILLVDDVYTSGATMREVARLFKRAGAKTIWGATVAGASQK